MARKKKNTRDNRFIFLLFTLILSGILLVVAIKTNSLPVDLLKKKPAPKAQFFPLANEFLHILAGFNIPGNTAQVQNTNLRILVPQHIHPAAVYASFSQLILQKGGTILNGRQTGRAGAAQLEFTYKTKQAYIIDFLIDRKKTTGPRIAIVIDDFGYKRGEVIRQLIDFPYEITYAVIPGLAKSGEIANELYQRNKTVFIHLPMEPMQGRVESGGYTLFTNLPEDEIRKRVRKAITAIPHAIGLNNHMGSKATADSATMAAALDEIKKAKLQFLDSRTSPHTVAFALATEKKIPAFLNNTFIDAVDEKTAIEEKLQRLAKLAKKDGFAIGIGHPRSKTIAVLKEMIPELARQGFVFIALNPQSL